MSDYEAGYKDGANNAIVALRTFVDEHGVPALLDHIDRDGLGNWVNDLIALARKSPDRDTFTVYPAGRPTTVTALYLTDERVVAGGETFSASFEMPSGAEPMRLAALIVRLPGGAGTGQESLCDALEVMVCVGPGSRRGVTCREMGQRIEGELEGRREHPNAYPSTDPPEQIEPCERCSLIEQIRTDS